MSEELLDKIQQKHSLKKVSVLQNSQRKVVYLMENENLGKYVLKIFRVYDRNIKKEIIFLKTVSNLDFRYICFPKLIESDRNYLLLEYHDRKYFTRDTILKKKWLPVDILIWVSGLIEFQNIPTSYKIFSPKERIKGFIYPIYIFCTRLFRFYHIIGIKGLLGAFKLALYYFYFSLYIKNVNTHYDLQTYNYTFLENEKKMSMLDFEMGAYKGDPLYDVVYYISIPVQGISQWTFQLDLLQKYIKETKMIHRFSKGLFHRLRFIILVCNLCFYLHFLKDNLKKKVYLDNINFILSDSKFKTWYRNTLFGD
jgi:hypothetical protein